MASSTKAVSLATLALNSATWRLYAAVDADDYEAVCNLT